MLQSQRKYLFEYTAQQGIEIFYRKSKNCRLPLVNVRNIDHSKKKKSKWAECFAFISSNLPRRLEQIAGKIES